MKFFTSGREDTRERKTESRIEPVPSRDSSDPKSEGSRPSVRRLSAGGAELAVEGRGRGPSLLCLHGLTAHRAVWDPVARLLEDRWRVWCPDLAGRGESNAPRGLGYGLEEETARVLEVGRRLELGSAVIAGHSNGAALALAAASAAPWVRGLVLANPVTADTARPLLLSLLPLRRLAPAAGPVVRRLREPVARLAAERVLGPGSGVDLEEAARTFARPYADPGRARALLEVLADWNPAALSDYLPPPPMPVLVLAGGADPRVPPGEARRLARTVGAGFELLAGAGHVLPVEEPARVADAVYDVAQRAGLLPCPPGGEGEDDGDSSERGHTDGTKE